MVIGLSGATIQGVIGRVIMYGSNLNYEYNYPKLYDMKFSCQLIVHVTKIEIRKSTCPLGICY